MRSRRTASFTAEAGLAARAHGALHPDPRLRNPDYVAARLLGMPFRLLLWPLLRGLMIGGFERRAPGIYFYHQARTHYIDAVVADEIASGLEQLVVLGAGFDTRSWRFADRLRGARVFEVDHPLTGAEKQRRAARLSALPRAEVTCVPVDFVRESLADRLPACGFEPTRRTLFLWEGVTMYLDAAAVDATLAVVAGTARGSSILFDYVEAGGLADGHEKTTRSLAYVRKLGEPYTYSLEPGALERHLSRSGLTLASHLDARTLEERHLVGSDGRRWGQLPSSVRIVQARV